MTGKILHLGKELNAHNNSSRPHLSCSKIFSPQIITQTYSVHGFLSWLSSKDTLSSVTTPGASKEGFVVSIYPYLELSEDSDCMKLLLSQAYMKPCRALSLEIIIESVEVATSDIDTL
ncbi:uncharacterized protein GJ701_006921 [Geothlypis trichas]